MRSAQNCARTCPGLNLKPYYFAVALPAKEKAALTVKQQQPAAQKAKAAADLALAQAKQKELELAEQKAQAAQDQIREQKQEKRSVYLAACQSKAKNVSWNYIKLNGTPQEGQPGVYNTPQYTWDEAKRQKQDNLITGEQGKIY